MRAIHTRTWQLHNRAHICYYQHLHKAKQRIARGREEVIYYAQMINS